MTKIGGANHAGLCSGGHISINVDIADELSACQKCIQTDGQKAFQIVWRLIATNVASLHVDA